MELSRDTAYLKEIPETKISRVSWAAVFGGTLIMLMTLMLLSLLGIGIGIGSINPMEEAQPLKGLGTGALIWWVISNIIAVFAGAYAAAKLTNLSYKSSGILHGILSWSLYTLISFTLMTSAIGGIISGIGGAVSKSLNVVGKGVSEAVPLAKQLDTDRINRKIQDALSQNQVTGMGSQSEGKEFDIDLMAVVQDVFIENGKINSDVDREKVVQAVADNSSLSSQDANRAADVIIQEYQQMKPQLQQLKLKAEETGQQVAETVSKAAIWAFIALVLGALTAAFGGNLGKPTIRETAKTVAL
ncbi:MAG TPA: hypothetical protein VK155_11460 [Bacteroidales bacterium]|jgi:hypothetical protein|nr:hypothetical protein [Bacteroidales bacterium]